MKNSLENLDKDLFQPLEASEANMVLGGARVYTLIGLTSHEGEIYNDYIEDTIIIIAV